MDFLANYFGSLNPMSFLSALPGNIAQGIIWGLMGLGVFPVSYTHLRAHET